jgi:ABC-type uncharacterized transport system ATPase subunit
LLSGDTTEEQINGALNFTDNDKKLLESATADREVKLKQDISKQKKDLGEECNDLNNLNDILKIKNNSFYTDKLEKINKIVKDIKDKKDELKSLSAKNLEFGKFKNIGSPEWRLFISAAQKLYEKETFSNDGINPDHCLLCRQTLATKEKELFEEYWKLLKSNAEAELLSVRQKLNVFLAEVVIETNKWPSFSETETAVKILKRDAPNELQKLEKTFNSLKNQILGWIENIKIEKDVVFYDSNIDLTPITSLIDKKRKIAEGLIDPTETIKKLTGVIINLTQKQRASNMLSKIKDYVSWLRWKKSIDLINFSVIKSNITRKKTEIMNQLVVSKYVDIFNEETKKLECNFGIKVDSHGQDGQTVKCLKLDFAPGYNLSDILSEGEQTVSALADFITEAKLDKNNNGIIFDDPVNSLDHLRKDVIAETLVEEAKERQVIVLTHDIAFLLSLQMYADNKEVILTANSIRKNGDRIGVTKQELPWIALNVKSRVGFLKNELPKIKKMENGDQDLYIKEVKDWYEHLREAWERSVEEKLFNGVVQRFNRTIQTQKLKKLKITPELVKEVDDGMTESSKWLHDKAPEVNPLIPDNAKREEHIKLLENFIDKCKIE